jgi:DNA segregation ATPase FtsK/SpoIIIE, S-DNA-T family
MVRSARCDSAAVLEGPQAHAALSLGRGTIEGMSFPLGSLVGDGAVSSASPNSGPHSASQAAPHTSANAAGSPLRRKVLLFVAALAWLLLLLALLTYSRADAAFTTSGTGEPMHNKAGMLGARVVDALYFLFGFSAWWILPVTLRAWLSALADTLRHAPDAPVAMAGTQSAAATKRAAQAAAGSAATAAAAAVSSRGLVWLGLALLLASSSALEWSRLHRFEGLLPGGHRVLGQLLGEGAQRWFGFAGSGVLWIALLVSALALAMRFSWLRLAERIGERLDGLREQREDRRAAVEDRRLGEMAAREREDEAVAVRAQDAQPMVPLHIEPAVVEVPISQRVAKERQAPLFSELADTKLPQVDLLDAAQHRDASVNPESLEMTSRLIEKKLSDFGVEVHVVAASPGPVITRYEIEPATGVKGSQIVGLAKDLARSLSLVSIRVVEVIPGKTTMALELPNARRQTIKLSEILGSEVYNQSASMLTIGMGKDIIGNPLVADLAKMPHCLVAGTTGSGKSVGINAMILSLLYKAEARDVRLILIDPKMLEMSVYEGIPHLLAPVVTDMKQAANALNWCVGEMERRYKIMSKLGVRNLSGYNKKILDAEAKGEKLGNPFSLTPEEPEPLQRLPQIVVVIDELADLMMVIGKKIEELIARLAQKARAAGIHLVLATQRPSVDVITGLIKANIPTRLSFQVSSKIDSRTILDQMGAEALLGQGDMLYLAPGAGVPVRVHGAFVSDEEVHRVVEYLKSQGEPNYIEGILEGGVLEGGGEGGGDLSPGEGGESDPMYDQAVGIVLQHRRASISLVQRHLRIGYNRAARLLEQMEKSGVVTAMSSNGNRDILVPAREGRPE